jgi:ferredoxin-NADP reductase/ferredoxin
VTKVVDESRVIRSFHLAPADSLARPDFQAGQHLPIRLRTAGSTELRRTYTVSHAPEDSELRLSVKREGVASGHLHDHLRVGDVVEALAPQGRFVIDAKARRPAVLIGAGVGITPIVAFARHLVAVGKRQPPMRPVHLIQVARDEPSRAFGAELQALADESQGAMRLHVVLSDTEGAPTGVHQGPLTVPMLQQWLPLDDYEFFLCGPGGFMQALYDGLRDLGIRDERIQAEAFGPSALRRRVAHEERVAANGATATGAAVTGADSAGMGRANGLAPAAISTCTALTPPTPRTQASHSPSTSPATSRPAAQTARILFKRTGREASWTPSDGTLLDFAERQGLAPPFSCRAGHCGSCATRITAGEVTYPTPITWQPAADEVLLCCAVPAAGANVGIELDL